MWGWSVRAPKAACVITQVETEILPKNERRSAGKRGVISHRVLVTYTYRVDGVEYTGHSVSHDGDNRKTEARAYLIVTNIKKLAYPVAKYNPNNHAQSMLDVATEKGFHTVTAFLISCVCFALVVYLVIASIVRIIREMFEYERVRRSLL